MCEYCEEPFEIMIYDSSSRSNDSTGEDQLFVGISMVKVMKNLSSESEGRYRRVRHPALTVDATTAYTHLGGFSLIDYCPKCGRKLSEADDGE